MLRSIGHAARIMAVIVAVVLTADGCVPMGSATGGATQPEAARDSLLPVPTPTLARPDQSLILGADANGNTDIYLIDVVAGSIRRLTKDPAPDFDPSFSPLHTQVAFRSERDGNPDIYVMDVDGGNQRNLTQSPASDYSPAWSPSGEWIAFASDRAGNRNDIFIIRPDGTDLRQLTSGPDIEEYPTWSPDSLTLAYTNESGGSIWMVRLAGGEPQPLVDDGELPAWSPDGEAIAFQAGSDRVEGIYLIGLASRSVTRISDGPGENPAWSDDGARIAFTWGGLFILDLAEGSEARVSLPGLAEVSLPDW